VNTTDDALPSAPPPVAPPADAPGSPPAAALDYARPSDPRRKCLKCGYDLRGTADDARCPECGLPAYWSLRAPRQLSQYPPAWVAMMSRAVRLLMLVYGGAFLMFLLAAEGILFDDEETFLFVFAAAAPLQAVGMWMLSRSSGHWSERRALLNRWALRLAPLGLVLAAGCGVAIELRFSFSSFYPLLLGGLLVGTFAPTAIFVRLRTVARMISNPHLAEHSAIVGWGFLVTLALAGGWIAYDYFNPGPHTGNLMFVIVGMVAVFGMLFLLWGAFIFCACAVDFGRAAKLARAEWSAGDPPV
jgi:hypothetical protein